MAIRIAFASTPEGKRLYDELPIEFNYSSGFAVSQKQKSINSMHHNIRLKFDYLKPLEISTKSESPLGRSLSAFNLKYYDETRDTEFPLENIFQSSKKFVFGGPFTDLLFVNPREAKKDERLQNSGKLLSFVLDDRVWTLEPKSMFYDWIYISALNRRKELHQELLGYNVFTDIEFNHQKSFNCQARSVAIFRSLKILGKIEEYLESIDLFESLYAEGNTQMTIGEA